jgi:hypothetical protein
VSEQKADERVFHAHVKAGPFQNGVERGRWRLVSTDWPYAVIAVRAAPRDRAPGEFFFRFELSNYPKSGPTASLWDPERTEILADGRWPGGKSRVSAAFNPGWKRNAVYLPCDRVAIVDHEQWKAQHPALLWSTSGDITQFLVILYDLLNSKDYTGIRCP